MRRGRALWLPVALALGSVAGVGAQNDTIPLVVLGGAMQDEGVAVAPLPSGGAWVLVRSNSMTTASNQGYLVRLDDSLQVQEVRTGVQWPFWYPVGLVAHADGGVSALGHAYGGAAAGYQLGWYHWPADGGEGGFVSDGGAAWDLPVGIERVGDAVFTGWEDYSSGWASPAVLVQTWSNNALSSPDTLRLAPSPFPRHMVALRTDGERVYGGGTWPQGLDGNGASTGVVWAWNLDGSVAWTHAPDLPNSSVVAMDWGPQGGIVVFAEALPNGEREMHFLRLGADGVPGLWMNLPTAVPLEARAVAWVGGDFAVLYETDAYGLGGQEWLYSRYDGAGGWQGGPTFGSPEEDVPVAMRSGSDGSVWMVGHSDGFGQGSRDGIVVRLPVPAVGDHVLEVFDATQSLPLGVAESAGSPGAHDGTGGWRAVPNPNRGRFQLRATPAFPENERCTWQLANVQGATLLQGEGWTVDVSHLPAGLYFLHVTQAQRQGVVRILLENE